MQRWLAMKAHTLSSLFQPKSVVVIGASETPGSLGARVFRNLLDAPWQGALYGVNVRHATVFGQRVYPSVQDLPAGEVDLVIITTAARTVLGLLRECGERGVKAVMLISRDFLSHDNKQQTLLDEAMALAAYFGMRLLGPNLLGLLRPASGLIAANYHGRIKPGNLALVAQSSSVASAILDWAQAHDIGFSTVVVLGGSRNIGAGEILDFLAQDNQTQGVLLYLEQVADARAMMSALWMLTRQKPVVCLKVGHGQDARNDSEGLAQKMLRQDEVFSAACRRLGVLRVGDMIQLTIAARMLAENFRVNGRRLAIVANGYGIGQMAQDYAQRLHLQLPRLSRTTRQRLRAKLPQLGSHDNPLDVLGDASPATLTYAVEACLRDTECDGVLLIFSPQAGSDDVASAQQMIALRERYDKLLMLVWLGDVQASRQLLKQKHMAYFNSPEHAVQAFASLSAWTHVQELSLHTPGPRATPHSPDLDRARTVLAKAGARGQLRQGEVLSLLDAFAIAYPASRVVDDVPAALAAAQVIGYPLSLRMDDAQTELNDVMHGQQLAVLAQAMLASGKGSLRLQHQPQRPHGRELMMGMARDPVFGPVISFGAGGVMADVLLDVAHALPPLNEALAHSLIRRARIKHALGAFKHFPAARLDALLDILLKLSELVCELPQISSIDLNPIVADEYGAWVLDAQVWVAPLPAGFRAYQHMAIHPYPSHLQHMTTLRQGQVCTIRPIRAEDADALQHFTGVEMSAESRYSRFLSTLKQLTPSMLARFTLLDYAREMALVATLEENGEARICGVARYTINPDGESCEFAISIGDRWQGWGIGSVLMNALFGTARDAGLRSMEGDILASNSAMLALTAKLGFENRPHPEDPALRWVVKAL